ncbi:MAG: hypothetical protein ACRECA_06505 [Pseudolabrys sp.]
MTHPLSRFPVLIAAALGLSLLGASAAQAFTFEGNTDASGGARYADPDAKFDSSGNAGDRTKIQQGNTTLQFGPAGQGSFDDRYNSNRMFDTLGGPGRDGYR